MTIAGRIRRFAAALLAVLIAAALPLGASAAGAFTDVADTAWYHDAVEYVVGRGLFKGTGDTVFSPNISMSRAMFVTVLGRFANVDPSAWTDSGGFTDVPAGAYYAGYAAWAKAKAVVNGVSETQFAPDANITREQMCAMLNRFASAMGLSLSQTGSAAEFPDSGQISAWAKGDMDAMQRCGVIKGDASGFLNPQGSATRAEAATMLMRFDSASGGGSGPVQQTEEPAPPVTDVPAATEEPAPPVTDVPAATEEPAPPEQTPLDPASVPDTPVSLVGGTVSLPAGVIRVGILVTTQGVDTSVPSVSLHTDGSDLEYGVMSGRQFSSLGAVGSADVTVTTDGSAFTLADPAGNIVYTTADALAIHPVSGGKAVTSVNGEYRYFGDFELRQASGKPGYINVVNHVGVEDYVKGVLPYEFPVSFPAEALKAAAIACRSYVMSYDWNIYAPYGMDILAGGGAQLYRGRAINYDASYFAASDGAVDATAGQYLTYNGSICVASFSSCDGGRTLDSSAVFGTGYAYLTGKEDPFEQAAKADIAAAGGNYDQMVSASHKVGMSAWGAYAMAKYYNKSCESILGFYYMGANLQYGA